MPNWIESAHSRFQKSADQRAATAAERSLAPTIPAREGTDPAAESSGHWLIIEPPTKTERWFTPAVTRSELEISFPGAVLVSLPDSAPDSVGQRTVTPAELDELFKLIPLVAKHYDCPPEELVEMRTAAARDPSGALVAFRTMASQLGINSAVIEPERFLTADQWLSLGKTR